MPPRWCTLGTWLVLLLALRPDHAWGSSDPPGDVTVAPAGQVSPKQGEAAKSGRWRERHRTGVFPSASLLVQRFAVSFQRVTQPRRDFKVGKGCTFGAESAANALEVTPKTGVVYVNDPSLLHDFQGDTDELNIDIVCANETFRHSFSVQLDGVGTQCGNETDSESYLCAEYSSRDKCRKGCGAGSSSFCSWRTSPTPDKMSQAYSTCSPDLEFCPNRECDELEQLDALLCPQDCTEHVFGSGMLSDKDGESGIMAATGVCVCTTLGKCTCYNEKSITAPIKSTKPTTTIPPPDDPGLCDGACMVFLIGCVTLLLVVLLATALYTKRFAQIILRRREALLGPKDLSGHQWLQDERPLEQETTFSCQPPSSKQYWLDSKWEFPRERLRVEKVLGEGEFGQVLQATAVDLPGFPGRTTVAVKALKEGAGSAELNDLITEYEHLKEVSHPNIISLLGACTTPGGPIYLIIEFADRGSLRSFLRKCRRGGREALAREGLSLKNLISYAWQISKGMEYLSEMKIVHRDLAARNILLTSKGVCKVSDFGLSRDVYVDDTYLKQSRGKVPVKWMALESLSEQIYTSKSDVWSYGVLLWELLTLGVAPYPGIAVQNLFSLLQLGYRMENPVPNSQCSLYHLMQASWAARPSSRPTFKHITSILNRILQEGADYLDITADMVSNQEYMHFFREDD